MRETGGRFLGSFFRGILFLISLEKMNRGTVPLFQIKNSSINTTTQQITDTGNNDNPAHAAIIPVTSATAPARGLFVASVIAGKVITARVT